MAISNRVKRNISLTLTIMGCFIVLVRIIDPILSRTITGKNCFEIFGAIVITWCAFDNFKIYHRRVRNGILFGNI